MLDLVPLGTRVIIEKRDVPEKVGSIYVPRDSREMEPTEGKVLAVGPDVTWVSVGDEVFFGRYSGFSFDRGGTKYVLCNEEDLLATIKTNAHECAAK